MNEKIKVVKNFISMRYFNKFKTREQLEKYQKKMLLKQMEYIKENSRYFKDIDVNNLEEFKQLPLMNKKIMMDNFNELNCVNIDKDEALEIAINGEKSRNFDEKLNNISVGLSSGTSGTRGLFIISDEERALWAGGVLAKFLPKGNIFGHKIAFFLRADNNLYETIDSKLIKFRYFDIIKNMNENMEILNEYQPTIIVAPPSVLLQIGKAQEENKIKVKPLKIVSVAEVLTKEDEEYFKKVFELKIIHQAYQSTEGFLGYVCECGNFHINEDIIYMEKEYIDKERFIPIITDFRRKSQPIIRYRLNDILVKSNIINCPCGAKTMVIKKIEGREDDIFIFKSLNVNNKDKKETEMKNKKENKKENIIVFPDFISRCIIYVEGIKNYKVVQEDEENITVYIDVLDEKIEEKIIKEFERLANKMEFKCPKISFEKYKFDLSRKMKRVERKAK